MNLTWDEIRSRSEARTPSGMVTFCFDCRFHFKARGVPCLRHTLKSERQARAQAIGAIR